LQVLFARPSKMRSTNPGWRSAAILKIENAISPKPCSRFWRNFTRWRILDPWSSMDVQKSHFEKSKMTDGRHFKINLKCYTSSTVWPISMKFSTLSMLTFPTKSAAKIWNFENRSWRTSAILKVKKIAIFPKSFRRFWILMHIGVSDLNGYLKIQILKKIQDGKRPSFWKSLNVICPHILLFDRIQLNFENYCLLRYAI